MGSKICMNERCHTKSSSEWKKGWALKSGESATLCYNCGSAYENFIFCDTFHLEETGWRDCGLCEKRIHCGCIASKLLHECLDFGGVACTSCLKHLDSNSVKSAQMPSCEIPNGTAIVDVPPVAKFDQPNIMRVTSNMDFKGTGQFFIPQKGETRSSLPHMNGYEVMKREVDARLPTFRQHSFGSSILVKPAEPVLVKPAEPVLVKPAEPVLVKPAEPVLVKSAEPVLVKPAEQNMQKEGVKDVYEPLPSLNFFLKNPSDTSATKPRIPDEVVECAELNKVDSGQQVHNARQILPKPTKAGSSFSSDVNNGIVAQSRVARPPADGKGRSQLLPRYWPRITDEELQQLSGDLKSTVVPLFEKMLSASDAGRIGRLVLPKACAELYFPTINHSDGLPIRLQDVTGKEWTFQFRFWPNNNSRMYVLEGVTPCIQNLQLQAGDTVTFSRIDLGGKLVIGFRKATNNADSEQPQTPVLLNGISSAGTPFSGADEKTIQQNGHRTSEDALQHRSIPEKKKARNLGSKNKRLRMHKDDSMELRLTWEEAQELFRPPPTTKPTVVMIEDYEFEEYEEPPVFGKKPVFTANPSGDQTQWAQCDTCKKWRKVPVDILLPARWNCSENIWDASRCSCSAPDEMIPCDLYPFNKSRDFRKRRVVESKTAEVCEPSGLDALATAAFLGDNIAGLAETSGGTTTKHPRHRAGCTCIVCIQPPSGKGKHLPTCKCSVCNSVKRRFRTLMLKKKRKQSERQAEDFQEKVLRVAPKDATEIETTAEIALLQMNHSNGKRTYQNGDVVTDIPESSKGQLDLNCQPSREDDMLAEVVAGLNMTTLINAASLPLDMYLKQNGLDKLSSCLLSNDAENHLDETETGTAVTKKEEADNATEKMAME